MAGWENFDLAEEALPEPGEGEFRVHVEYVSLDPAMRGWIAPGKSYVPPVEIGAVMRAFSAGHVDRSNHPDFPEGQAVAGLFGVQTHAISDGKNVVKADTDLVPLPTWIGGLGMPGMTAYHGLLTVGQPKAGETVVVSAASGAVGALVGQIAKIKDCRVVGIAGGPTKCRYLVEELGFDGAIDYKNETVADSLKTQCPKGIDIYFENVGGSIFNDVLGHMNRFGRIPVCGLIAHYNATEPVPPLTNLRSILVNRLRVQGLIVFDFTDRYGEAQEALARWYREGRIKFREDIREGGLNAFPETLNLLYTGGNFGKLVLKL